MGLFGWLDRLAGKVDRKLEPSAATVGTENAPNPLTPVGIIELEQEEREAQEGEGA
jgi:hypothetical protein